MKNLISFFDIPIVIIVMFIVILLLKRFNVIYKKNEEQLEKEILMEYKNQLIVLH